MFELLLSSFYRRNIKFFVGISRITFNKFKWVAEALLVLTFLF
jgi:hypothetical protein